jgi:hypothetical protein
MTNSLLALSDGEPATLSTGGTRADLSLREPGLHNITQQANA